MQKTASKNIICNGSYEFLNLAHNTNTITIQARTFDIRCIPLPAEVVYNVYQRDRDSVCSCIFRRNMS